MLIKLKMFQNKKEQEDSKTLDPAEVESAPQSSSVTVKDSSGRT
jgi:hypothetical protein